MYLDSSIGKKECLTQSWGIPRTSSICGHRDPKEEFIFYKRASEKSAGMENRPTSQVSRLHSLDRVCISKKIVNDSKKCSGVLS